MSLILMRAQNTMILIIHSYNRIHYPYSLHVAAETVSESVGLPECSDKYVAVFACGHGCMVCTLTTVFLKKYIELI